MTEGGSPRGQGPLRRLGDAWRRSSDRVLGSDLLWSVAFVGVALLLLGGQRCASPRERLAAGDVAPRDIRAERDLEIRDDALTRRERAEARGMVPEVYVRDGTRATRLAADLAAELRARGDLPAPVVTAIDGILRDVMQGSVIANKAILARERDILLVHVPGNREERIADYGGFLEVEEARRMVRARVRELPDLPPSSAEAAADLAASFVDANVAFDPEGTAARREAAAGSVLPIQIRIPKGTVLARHGEVIGPEAAVRIEEMRRQAAAGPQGTVAAVGLLFVLSLLAFFLWRYTRYHQRAFRKVRHLHALLIVTLLGMLVITHGMLWVAAKVTIGVPPPFDDVEAYTYVVPVGAGAILVTLLANGRIAMVFSTFAALLFGAATGWDALRVAWALLVQWAGIYAITTYRERAALLRAGLVCGTVAGAAALAVEAVARTLDPFAGSLYGAALGFLGGALGVGLLVSFALPVLEGVFKVLTDIRLLELSNVNHPLLAQLAVKAPGTYNHSLIVGTLAEEAAKAIGANSLFCRVAAFYHDIGKIRKPEYYVENQRGANPHDRLAPSMSALIITAHVKDGIRMAREAGLPEQIVDVIPQHHGTRLMGYFLEKARRAADPTLGEVREDDFRYPGPKPQSREAAIFMIADGIEAAARTLQDPTAGRLREVIHKITSAIVLDGQLDECDLTFADLEKIEQAMLRTLIGMHHHRVDYPGFDFGKPRGELRVARGS